MAHPPRAARLAGCLHRVRRLGQHVRHEGRGENARVVRGVRHGRQALQPSPRRKPDHCLARRGFAGFCQGAARTRGQPLFQTPRRGSVRHPAGHRAQHHPHAREGGREHHHPAARAQQFRGGHRRQAQHPPQRFSRRSSRCGSSRTSPRSRSSKITSTGFISGAVTGAWRPRARRILASPPRR